MAIEATIGSDSGQASVTAMTTQHGTPGIHNSAAYCHGPAAKRLTARDSAGKLSKTLGLPRQTGRVLARVLVDVALMHAGTTYQGGQSAQLRALMGLRHRSPVTVDVVGALWQDRPARGANGRLPDPANQRTSETDRGSAKRLWT